MSREDTSFFDGKLWSERGKKRKKRKKGVRRKAASSNCNIFPYQEKLTIKRTCFILKTRETQRFRESTGMEMVGKKGESL